MESFPFADLSKGCISLSTEYWTLLYTLNDKFYKKGKQHNELTRSFNIFDVILLENTDKWKTARNLYGLIENGLIKMNPNTNII